MRRLNRQTKRCRRESLNKGQVTVEAAVLFPLVIIIVVGLYSTAKLWNEKALFQFIVQEAAEYGAQLISANSTILGADISEEVGVPLYPYLIPQSEIVEDIRKKIMADLAECGGVTVTEEEVIIKVTRLLYTCNFDVSVQHPYYFLPMGVTIGFPLKVDIEVSGHAQCCNPSEFLRLTDLVFDLAESIGVKEWGMSFNKFRGEE